MELNYQSKKLFGIFAIITLFAGEALADGNRLRFTENRGQVSDQHFQPRPEVLYSGGDGAFVFHLKKNGVSYQICKTDELPSHHATGRTDGRFHRNAQRVSTIYRLDIAWDGCKSDPKIIRGKLAQGYSNFYSETCPVGALQVPAYESITYKGLYNGIGLHWYGSEGHLKYDYLVDAGADYRQIAWRISGAQSITVDKDGNLVIGTPLGAVTEEAPIVVQQGRRLPAKWIVNGNRISFQITGINASAPFIIDPLVRLWGTYFGGNGLEFGGYGCVDLSGNSFLAGQTSSTGNIATTGAFQTTFGGPGNGAYPGDAFVAKFDPQGQLLWATYYGGAGCDFSNNCATDSNGDLYFVGGTNTTNSAVIASAGCYQPTFAGGNNIGDGLIVKLNAAGARVWATYYGDITEENLLGVALAPNGDLLVSGGTSGAPFASTVLATPGSFQTVNGGPVNNTDAILARFTASGARIWATYYGAEGDEYSTYCTSDLSGNFLMVGYTSSTLTAAMITPGCHQPVPSGNFDALIVKFDASGHRDWATYYGGVNDEISGNVTTDKHGNVFVAGATASPQNISTTGSHKSSLPFGRDAFLVKFSPSGVRSFGTYYGGTGTEDWGSCAVDAAGYIYMVGITASGTTSDIATPCSFQPNYGGGSYDCFLAKFDTLGTRIWGTYYGGSGNEWDPNAGYWPTIFTNTLNEVFIGSGVDAVSSAAIIGTPGSYQTNYGGGPGDSFLAKFDGCIGIVMPSDSMLIKCAGKQATISTQPACGTQWYSGLSGNNLIVAGTLVTTALNSDTTFYAEDLSCGTGLPRTAVNITITPAPSITIAASATIVCSGDTVTLKASGAASYVWALPYLFSGSLAVVNPTATAFYAVSGTDPLGCESTATITISASPCLSVHDDPAGTFRIHPNPNSGTFYVTSESESQLVLLNELGQTLRPVLLTRANGFSACIQELIPGLYYLRDTGGNTTLKIVVAR